MALPQHVAAALDELRIEHLDGGSEWLTYGTVAREHQCAGAKFHSPYPLVLHSTSLAPSGEGRTEWLCGTCRYNLRLLQRLLEEHSGELPWVVRREFGNVIRALAIEGWRADHLDDDEGDGR